ncbi:MAG: cell division protein SepF [Clostridia bacterium]|nr:cell division protein SepF [Clostridia bacterium]
MKSFGKKTRNEYGYDESYEGGFYNPEQQDEDEGVVESFETAEPAVEEETQAPAPKAPQNPASSGMLKVLAPRSYDDAPSIVKHLRAGYTVVLNIEGMERASAMRLIDFLLGAIEVLEGDFRPVTKTTLVFSPSGAVSSDDDEYDEEGDN